MDEIMTMDEPMITNITAPNYFLQRVIDENVIIDKVGTFDVNILNEVSQYSHYLPKLELKNITSSGMNYVKTNLTKFYLKDSVNYMNSSTSKIILAQTGVFFITLESWSNGSKICEYDKDNKKQWERVISPTSISKELLIEMNNNKREIFIFDAITGEYIYGIRLNATTYTGKLGFGFGRYGTTSSMFIYVTPFVWETDIGGGSQIIDTTKAKLKVKMPQGTEDIALLDIDCVIDPSKIDLTKVVDIEGYRILTKDCLIDR